MANVQDVAKFFIDLAQKRQQQYAGDLMTNLRLQKLLYFAQGWSLARYGRPLFNAPIVAWKYGPVVQEVYKRYNANSGNGIFSDAGISSDALTPEELSLLLDVSREYDRFSTSQLVDLSHVPGGPWAETPQSAVIPTGKIQQYFSQLPPLPSFDDLLSRMEVIEPRRDENGRSIFPAEVDEDWGDYDAD